MSGVWQVLAALWPLLALVVALLALAGTIYWDRVSPVRPAEYPPDVDLPTDFGGCDGGGCGDGGGGD